MISTLRPANRRLAMAPLALVLALATLIGALNLPVAPILPGKPALAHGLAFAPGRSGVWEAHDPQGTLTFRPDGIRLDLPGSVAPAHLDLRFIGAQTNVALVGERQSAGVVNRYLGTDPAGWREGVATYAGLSYQGLYPGIDLHYEGRTGALKGTYLLAPGADPSAIRWAYENAESVAIDPNGGLVIRLAGGRELVEHAPLAWQELAGRQVPVAVRFKLVAGEAGFVVGAYDPTLPLVIDPDLVYGTYLGGLEEEYANGIAVDGEGNIYLTGRTYSDDFPLNNGARATDRDIFITKLDPTGTQIIYSTLIGGRSGDDGIAIAVSPSGAVVVTAYTASDDLPLKDPLLDALPDGNGALIRLAPSGALVQSTYLNLEMYGAGRNVGLDRSGTIYLAGTLDDDIVVAKLSPAGSLLAEQQIGGRWPDEPFALAVSPDGRVYLTGETDGWDNDFPTTADALQPVCRERIADPKATCYSEAFLVILDQTLAVTYSSYLGGSYLDGGNAIALDPSGNVVVAGTTLSADFPTKNALYAACPDGLATDSVASCNSFAAFVTKFTPDGKQILFSTYFSSPDWSDDVVRDVVTDADGTIYTLGWTNSTRYPVKDAPQPNLAAGICSSGSERLCEDAVITAFSPAGTLRYSTYLGGTGKEYPQSLAVAPGDDLWITGLSESHDFPTTAGGLQPQKSLNADIFLARIGIGSIPSPGNDHRIYLPLLRR